MILKQSLARLRMRFNGAETASPRGSFTFSLRGLSGRAIEADAKPAYSRICDESLGTAASAGAARKERSPTNGLRGGSGAWDGAGSAVTGDADAVRNVPSIFLRLAK
jgi:hypothetical protein